MPKKDEPISYEDIRNDKQSRIRYWEKSFWFWFSYHFWWKMKRFQKEWADSMQSDKNTFIEAFRASRKTTLARWYVCRCIAYKKEPSIVVQSFEDSLSGEWVMEVAKMLFQSTVVMDHWYLFPIERKKEDLSKRSLSNFSSTNWVKIAAKSLGQTIRWTNTFDLKEWISARPTLLVLDDIDVVRSITTLDLINKNEKKILWETIPALDPLRRKIIFLGNTIEEDWVVPRFRKRYKDTDTRDMFHQPLFDKKWNNLRPEVFTEKVVQDIKDDGKISFNQNYLLIPAPSGSGVFTREYFDYFLLSHFEEVDGILKKDDLKCGLFIDPAFSTSRKSDDAVCIWAWEHLISKKYYIIDWYADTSAPSKTIKAVIVMYNKMKMDWFEPQFLSVESVTINKQQTQFIQDLRDALLKHQINVPVYLFEPKEKKENRIKFNLESIMSQKGIKFNRNMSDPKFIPEMEKQFLEFSGWDKDDICDTVAQMAFMFREYIPNKNKTTRETRTERINPITWAKLWWTDPRKAYLSKLGIKLN